MFSPSQCLWVLYISDYSSFLLLIWPLLTSWRIETESIPRPPPVRASSLPAGRQASSDACGIYPKTIVMFFGLCKGVLAYPRFIASYTVSVRQYRILQSRFLQCILHSKPPCDLLIFRSTTSAYKGLTPSGKIHLLFGCLKNICIFGLFQQLTTSVRCSMQGTHKGYT